MEHVHKDSGDLSNHSGWFHYTSTTHQATAENSFPIKMAIKPKKENLNNACKALTPIFKKYDITARIICSNHRDLK